MTPHDLKSSDTVDVVLGDAFLDASYVTISSIYLNNARYLVNKGFEQIKDSAGVTISVDLTKPSKDYGKVVGLTDRERVLYTYLIQFKFYNSSEIRPSLQTLAGMMGKSVDAVRKTKNSLVEKGLLTVTSRPGKPHIFDLSEVTRQIKLWAWFWSEYSDAKNSHILYPDVEKIPTNLVPQEYIQSFIWHYILELPETQKITNFRDTVIGLNTKKQTPCEIAGGSEIVSDPLRNRKGTPCEIARGIRINNKIKDIDTNVSSETDFFNVKKHDESTTDFDSSDDNDIGNNNPENQDSDTSSLNPNVARAFDDMRSRISVRSNAVARLHNKIVSASIETRGPKKPVLKKPSDVAIMELSGNNNRRERLIGFVQAVLEHWSPFDHNQFSSPSQLNTKKAQNRMYGQYIKVASRLNDVSFICEEQGIAEFMPSDMLAYKEWLTEFKGFADAGLPAVEKWVDAYIAELVAESATNSDNSELTNSRASIIENL